MQRLSIGGKQKDNFELWEVLALDSVYLAYIAVMVFGVLKVFA